MPASRGSSLAASEVTNNRPIMMMIKIIVSGVGDQSMIEFHVLDGLSGFEAGNNKHLSMR